MLKPWPRDCLGSCGFLCPTQRAALPVIAGMNWSITLRIVREEWTAPKRRFVMHRGGLAAPSIAPVLRSLPLPLHWDLLQPSSSSSSWDVPLPQVLPPAAGPHNQTPASA